MKYGKVNIWNLSSSKRLLKYVLIVKECILHIVYKQVSFNNNKTTHFSLRWASSSWFLGIIICFVVKCSSNNLIPNMNLWLTSSTCNSCCWESYCFDITWCFFAYGFFLFPPFTNAYISHDLRGITLKGLMLIIFLHYNHCALQ